jgi:circadian clock protein KaiB
LSFRLYVAAASPNTRRALENLRALCSAAGHVTYDLKIIDVLREPQRALQDGILVAPTLVKVAPGPVRTVIGDLSDRDAVLATLELAASKERG